MYIIALGVFVALYTFSPVIALCAAAGIVIASPVIALGRTAKVHGFDW